MTASWQKSWLTRDETTFCGISPTSCLKFLFTLWPTPEKAERRNEAILEIIPGCCSRMHHSDCSVCLRRCHEDDDCNFAPCCDTQFLSHVKYGCMGVSKEAVDVLIVWWMASRLNLSRFLSRFIPHLSHIRCCMLNIWHICWSALQHCVALNAKRSANPNQNSFTLMPGRQPSFSKRQKHVGIANFDAIFITFAYLQCFVGQKLVRLSCGFRMHCWSFGPAQVRICNS